MHTGTSTSAPYSAASRPRAAGASSSRSVSPAASVKSLSWGGSATGLSAASNGPSPVGVELYDTTGCGILRDAACSMPAPAVAAAECGADGEPLPLPGFEATAASTLPPNLAANYRAQPGTPAPPARDDDGSSGIPTPHALAPGCPRRGTLPGRPSHRDPEVAPSSGLAVADDAHRHHQEANTQQQPKPILDASCVSGSSSIADHDLLLPPPRHPPVKITTTVYRQGKISRAEALERVRAARERRAEREADAQAAFIARVQGVPSSAAAAAATA